MTSTPSTLRGCSGFLKFSSVVCAALIFIVFVIALAMTLGVQQRLNILDGVSSAFPNLDPNLIPLFIELIQKQIDFRNHVPDESDHLVRIPKFKCPIHSPSSQVPTSVHELLPGDIQVVAAMGDSLTAAFGAKAETIFTMFIEYRGISWSVGGDDSLDGGVVTLANILRKYNPNLIGFSVETGRSHSSNANFNQAVSGSLVQDLTAQAEILITRMKSPQSGVNFEQDWKMLTIWTGPNNLCNICTDPNTNSPQTYSAQIEKLLDLLKTRIPRLFVNLVPPLDVTLLYPLNNGFCGLLHELECSCGCSSDVQTRNLVSAMTKEYQNEIFKIANKSKYSEDDEFAVVVQPWPIHSTVPTKLDGSLDSSYLAPDCFHFGIKSHANAALALWNNIVEPVSRKRTQWQIDEPFKCPAKGEFLYTSSNS